MDKRKMSQSGATTAAGRMAYEGKVGVEAVVRSGGKNPQLKGVVHEILYRDSITMAPDNLIHGTKGALSKSATAIRDDVLTMQGGKVIGRAQLKDTVSSINKTVKQASSGKYAGTNLMGTKETAAAYNSCVDKLVAAGKQAPQKMTSTGISSSDTARIAIIATHIPCTIGIHPPGTKPIFFALFEYESIQFIPAFLITAIRCFLSSDNT